MLVGHRQLPFDFVGVVLRLGSLGPSLAVSGADGVVIQRGLELRLLLVFHVVGIGVGSVLSSWVSPVRLAVAQVVGPSFLGRILDRAEALLVSALDIGVQMIFLSLFIFQVVDVF